LLRVSAVASLPQFAASTQRIQWNSCDEGAILVCTANLGRIEYK
jgi:hypothetical protein